MKDQLVQDARRLMGAPAGVDVCAVLEKEVGNLEVVVDDRPGERHVEHVLRGGRIPCVRPRARLESDSRIMLLEIPAERAGLVEPPLHPRESPVPAACGRSSGSGQIDEHWNEVCFA